MKEAASSVLKKLILFVVVVAALAVAAIAMIPRWLGLTDGLQKADAIVAISGGDTPARTNEAIRLYHEQWAPALIFSGAAQDPQSPSNAEMMRQTAIRAGVPPSAIEVEEQAGDTMDNAAETAKIVRAKGYKTIILVTSPYHQRRAWLEFKAAVGSEVVILNRPAPQDRHWPAHTWWTKPYSLALGIGETVKTAYVELRQQIRGNNE